eukprot:gene15522-20570_t
MVTYIEAFSAPMKNTGVIRIYGPEAFEGMRKACQLTARCLDALWPLVKPGVTTNELDRFVLDYGLAHDALPATLNYRGYRKSSCTSINHVVCHGIPDDKPLRDGDIVNRKGSRSLAVGQQGTQQFLEAIPQSQLLVGPVISLDAAETVQHDDEGGVVGFEENRLRLHEGLELFVRFRSCRNRRADGEILPLQQVDDHLVEDVLLGVEVVVDGRLGDANGLGDVVQRGAIEAIGGEQFR